MNNAVIKNFFQGKNCVITGASSGIGNLLTSQLFDLGANIIIVARREHLLQALVTECEEKGNGENTISYCVADIGVMDGAQKLLAFVKERFDTIDVIIANAGASMHANIAKSDSVVYHTMMKSNYYSLVNIILVFLPMLTHTYQKTKNKSTIAAITSIQSVIGVPHHAAYVAAKHAAGGFLETLELEEPHINIVEIMPGWVSGTDIRNSAIDGYGNIVQNRESHKRHSRSSITIEECVESTIDAIVRNKRLVYKPDFWKHILFVKYSMRNYLHRLIKGRQQYSSSS